MLKKLAVALTVAAFATPVLAQTGSTGTPSVKPEAATQDASKGTKPVEKQENKDRHTAKPGAASAPVDAKTSGEKGTSKVH
jgi:hypothetical protein